MFCRSLSQTVAAVVLSLSSTAAFSSPQPLSEQGPLLASPLVVVQDAKTGKILFSKNSEQAVSMASLTKLMTAMVILDGPTSWLDATIAIEESDVDTLKNSSSRVPVGTTWTVRELLHLALMASDNRAAHALGRVYPGGLPTMLTVMNKKARDLGLTSTIFEDTSGLNPNNRTTPLELAYMTSHAAQYALIREFSTDQEETFHKNGKALAFHNTNAVVRDQKWPSLWLSKTGFTNEAGRCVTMMGRLAGKDITLVLMAGVSSASRTLDIQRIQHWLDGTPLALPVATKKDKLGKAVLVKTKTNKKATKSRVA